MILKPVTSDAALDVLKEAGVIKPPATKNDLRELLESTGLGLESVVEEMSRLANDSSDPMIRTRNLENAMKLHQKLEEDKASMQHISITILPLSKEVKEDIPPILLPRAEQAAV